MKNSIKKLLSGETIVLRKDLTNNLPMENENIYAYTTAKVLEGKINKVIDISLDFSAQEINCPQNEIFYDSESIYRLPYTEDKELLEKMLELVKKQSHSYNANRI